jgi:hypothetical protein
VLLPLLYTRLQHRTSAPTTEIVEKLLLFLFSVTLFSLSGTVGPNAFLPFLPDASPSSYCFFLIIIIVVVILIIIILRLLLFSRLFSGIFFRWTLGDYSPTTRARLNEQSSNVGERERERCRKCKLTFERRVARMRESDETKRARDKKKTKTGCTPTKNTRSTLRSRCKTKKQK